MKNIRNKLSLATCGLLSQHVASAAEIDNAWIVDSSVAHYSEKDRVAVNEFIANVKGVVSDTDTVNLKAILDTMSGATPSGSVKKSNLTYTGASGGSVSSGTSQTASLSRFDDVRAAMTLGWNHDFNRLNSINYNGTVSIEHDYQSFGGGATYKRSTADRRMEFSLGVAGATDRIFIVGTQSTPVPMSEVSKGQTYGEGSKNTVDMIAGVNFVINRRTITQINIAGSNIKGYLNDPYKIFSIVDSNGIEYNQYYESRPNSRIRKSITFKLNHQLYPSNNILSLSYRYYKDDWQVKSHTLDMLYNIHLSDKTHLIPHLRLYTQSHAYFYGNEFTRPPTDPIPISQELPQYFSADSRLDDMNSITGGMTLSQYIGDAGHLRTRLEYIHQSFKHAEYDVNSAWVFQMSYQKKF